MAFKVCKNKLCFFNVVSSPVNKKLESIVSRKHEKCKVATDSYK